VSRVLFFGRYDCLYSDDDNINTLLKKTHAQLSKLFQKIAKGLFLDKDNFLHKKIDAGKNEKWNGSARKLSELNKLEFIDNKITKDELARRIRAFHANDYPLKIKLHNHVFFPKEKIMTPFKKL